MFPSIVLFILLHATSSLGTSSDVNFIETPSDVTVLSGETISLKCQSITPNAVKYRWFVDGKELQIASHSSKRKLIGGNLLIKYADPLIDAGQYVCETQHTMTGEKIQSEPATVRVRSLENNVSVVLIHPQHVSQISSAQKIILQCAAKSSEKLRVDWLRNGERVTKSDRVVLEEHELIIERPTLTDNGVYRCTVTNKAGSAKSIKNFPLVLPNDNGATITVIPEDRIAPEGHPTRIDCVYKNADVIEWYFQEKGPLESSTRHTILANGSLIVNNASKIDEGMYACVGIKQESTAVPPKYTAVLTLAFISDMKPTTSLDPNDTSSHAVPEGGVFEINCIAPRGNPPPNVKWTYTSSGKQIENFGRVKTSGSTLIVSKANAKDDSVSYTCVATNLAGSREVSFQLVVVVFPSIKKNPASKEVKEGTDVSTTCEYVGTAYPYTQILWYKDRTPLPTNSSRIFVDKVNGTLYIASVELNDAGNYYCVANTTFFSPVKSKPGRLSVQQTLKFYPIPMGKKMELGMPNKIPCKAEGKDVPFVKWIKGDSVKNAQSFPPHVYDSNGTLHFSKVQQQDEGKYTCIANNSQGEIFVTVDVDVVVTPKFTILPKNPTESYEGASIRLDCAAEGDPAPTIQWDNKLVNLSQERFHILPNGSLLVDALHLNDEGYYGCTAGNSGGFNRTEVALIVRGTGGIFRSDEIDGDTVGKTVVITLGAACAYILLVIVLMAWCRYRRKKKKRSYADANGDGAHLDEDLANGKCNSRNPVEMKETVLIRNEEAMCGSGEDDDENDAISSQSCNRSLRLSGSYDKYNFAKENIHDIMLLGQGKFGSVYLARNRKNCDAVVMVKVLEELKDEFKRQLHILSRAQHDNVVKLVGLCRESKPYYMVLEYTDWGDLKQFLIATRKNSTGVTANKERPAPLSVKQSVNIAKQAANALEHLSSLNCVHGDVAARNCLITSSLNIKITFSSLCKTTYAAEYHVIRNQPVPIRWLPLEAIKEDEFTSKTDAYSFACLVWEVFAKGELPFGKFSNKEFITLLEKSQIRWKLSKNVPLQMQTVLNDCWSRLPDDRPTFSQICVRLADVPVTENLVDDTRRRNEL